MMEMTATAQAAYPPWRADGLTSATTIADTEATTRTNAATASVVGRPSHGINAKPAASVPATDPSVFTAYTSPNRLAGECAGSPASESASAKAAPRQIDVGR